MSMGEILALGAIAGFTVFLGLPLGRMRSASTRVRSLLNAGATGILLFLFSDVLFVAQKQKPSAETVA